MNFAPLLIAAGIVAVVAVAGFFISRWRQAHVFRDYEEYASDAQSVADKLNAEVFRDRNDVVLSGNYGRLPTVARLSHADDTPGLNVKMRAPATFTMSVIPKGANERVGRTLLRTPDDGFDARFATRTDHPTQAKIFISSKAALAQIQKLCCSGQTYLTITSEGVELSELTIPSPYTAQHIQNHLESMAALAAALQQMPGADEIKIAPFKKETSKVIRGAIAVGALATVVAVGSAMFDAGSTAAGVTPTPELVAEGLTSAEAQRIGAGPNFRLARPSDFDSGGQSWVLSQTGHGIVPLMEAAFSADGARETAYILVHQSGADAGKSRVVIYARNQVIYDAAYPQLALAAIVPRANLGGIPWVKTPAPADGDALLLVRTMDDAASGMVIYLSRGRTEAAFPQTYQSIAIQ